MHVDQVVEAVVVKNLGVEDHYHVDAEKHPEHVLVEIEVYRALGLRIGRAPVELHPLPPKHERAARSAGGMAPSVTAIIILEDQMLIRVRAIDQRTPSAPLSVGR